MYKLKEGRIDPDELDYIYDDFEKKLNILNEELESKLKGVVKHSEDYLNHLNKLLVYKEEGKEKITFGSLTSEYFDGELDSNKIVHDFVDNSIAIYTGKGISFIPNIEDGVLLHDGTNFTIQKITDDYFHRNSISGNKIKPDSLGFEQVPDEYVGKLLNLNSLDNTKFAKFSINKFKDESIIETKLSPEVLNKLNNKEYWEELLDDNSYDNFAYSVFQGVNSNDVMKHLDLDNIVLSKEHFTKPKIPSNKFDFGKNPINIDQFQDNSIDVRRVIFDYFYNPKINAYKTKAKNNLSDIIEKESVTFEKLSPYLQNLLISAGYNPN